MSNYIDINTRKEYDEIPQGKILPIIINGLAVTELAYDNYMSLHPSTLDEFIVTPSISLSPTETELNLKHRKQVENADLRVQQTALTLPGMFQVLGINFTSPTIVGRGIYDAATGKNGFFRSVYFGNNGVFPDDTNPIISTIGNMLLDGGIYGGLSKFYQWGTTPRVVRGTETPLVEYIHFSPRVTKHTTITPAEMHIRNNTPGFVRSTYKGVDSNGLYVYTLPKIWFPKNPRIAFNRVLNNALKKGYEKITHPNLQGPALLNKRLNRVVSDFGETGQGQVGWTWKGAGFGDAAFETIPEFKLAMEKKGGKINGV